MQATAIVLAAAILAAGSPSAADPLPSPADPPPPPAAPEAAGARLAVKEITVFKDGHAFVIEEGEAVADASGTVVLDRLPAPVLGTFWAYAAEPGIRLRSVTAGVRPRPRERTALSLREILEANVGAEAIFTETSGLRWAGTIAGIPEAEDAGDPSAPSPRASPAPREGNIILVRTEGGTKALPVDRIQDVSFLGPCATKIREDEKKPVLALDLEAAGGGPARGGRVGMGYIQKGLRWIPDYRIELDGKGTATVRLQATLIDELVDLEGTTLHLVIGVPGIAFKDTVDPISLQKTLAPLSDYFREDAGTRFALSNAIMSQQARMGEARRPGAAPAAEAPDLGPEIAGESRTEDLFIFTIEKVRMKKGERMVLPIAEFSISYRDIFALELPFSPPAEARRNLNDEQAREIARLLASPKAVHKLRLENRSRYPLTTAPALVLEGGRLIAQSLVTYTAPGGTSDVSLTKAVNIGVRRSDVETGRIPRAEKWNGNDFARVDMTGKISLANHLSRAVEMEVTRHILGRADEAGAGGKAEGLDIFEDGGIDAEGAPSWWGWYSWPVGWRHMNGHGRFSWTVSLEPGKTVELDYKWHYFWP